MNQHNQRIGDYCELYSGIKFYILDPKEEEINLIDIAHSLSLNTRFNGHCSKFYSVAQHSVLAAIEAFDRKYSIMHQLSALFHDASECYISDVAKPIKGYFTNYKEIEERILQCIYKKFNITIPHDDPLIKQIDNDLLTSEAFYLMSSKGKNWSSRTDTIIKIKEFWSPERAEKEFTFMANWLMQEIKRNERWKKNI
jgi:hypothetical protein